MGVRRMKGRSRRDPGKIHRSKGFSVQRCRKKCGKGDEKGRCWRREQGTRIRARGGLGEGWGEDETRTIEYRGVLGSLSGERRG